MAAARVFKSMLVRDQLWCIGVTTLEEYSKCMEIDAALLRKFQQVHIAEPSVPDTINILRGLKEIYEGHHGVRILDRALVAAAQLSTQYITDRRLPDKAINLVDKACANVKVQLYRYPEEIDNLEMKKLPLQVELHFLEKEKDKARIAEVIKEQDYLTGKLQPLMMKYKKERIDEFRQLKRKKEEIQVGIRNAELRYKELEEVDAAIARLTVKPEHIVEVVRRTTGVSVIRIGQNEEDRFIELAERLRQKVVGQDQAVSDVERVIRSRALLGRPEQPAGSFLFSGPSSIGKAGLAKALAEQLFGDENQMVIFYMSQYMGQDAVAKLIGAPPGHVGHEEGGELTEAVRRRPHIVVLLKQMEKAHASVFNTLLQVLDSGRLTDGQGRTVDFRNTIIIMTSNLGGHNLLSGLKGVYPMQLARDYALNAVKFDISQEFLCRLDKIVVFEPLRHDQLREVARLQLKEIALRQQLVERPVALVVTDAALDYIVAENYDPVCGARPTISSVEVKLVAELAKLLTTKKENDENLTLYVDALPNRDGLDYRMETNARSADEQPDCESCKCSQRKKAVDLRSDNAAQALKKIKIER